MLDVTRQKWGGKKWSEVKKKLNLNVFIPVGAQSKEKPFYQHKSHSFDS